MDQRERTKLAGRARRRQPLAKTQRILTEANLEPRSVPLKTISPLLEGVAYEDERDESMIDRWAALLARATSGESEVPPGYVRVLSELSGTEAQLLDQIYDDDRHGERRRYARINSIPPAEAADLVRLGLIEYDESYEDERWRVTAFGREFVRLCKPLSSSAE